jgi:hypothetical protein
VIALLLPMALAGAPERLAAGDYDGAATEWADQIDGGAHSADLYYDLGVALYRGGHLGPAICAWQRAAWLSPRDADVRVNLSRATGQTVDAVAPPSEPAWTRWAGPGELGWLGVLGLGGGVLGLAAGVAARRRPALAWVVSGIGVGSALLAAPLCVGANHRLAALETPVGVVLEPAVQVRSTGAGGVVLFELHEGTSVRVREVLQDQVQIELEDGRRGWMPDAALGVVDPGAPAPRPG